MFGKNVRCTHNLLMVRLGGDFKLNIFYFHPYWGKIPILTIIFFKGVGSTTS